MNVKYEKEGTLKYCDRSERQYHENICNQCETCKDDVLRQEESEGVKEVPGAYVANGFVNCYDTISGLWYSNS